jgi:hypothetical protein
MKSKLFLIALILPVIVTISSCNKELLFVQPSIEVTGYTLKELPGEYTYLDIDMLVTNNDDREAFILDIEYLAVIEGFSAESVSIDINKTITPDAPLELTLPLTLKTVDAIKLLTMLDAGESLDYVVTGIFHVDKAFVEATDFPIDITGSAYVETGFEDFFDQPEVVVNSIDGTYTINGYTSYTFDLTANTTITNMDTRSAVIDEVEYTVTTEGVKSSTHLYSDTYTSNLSINGSGNVTLDLPVTYNVNITQGAAMAAGMADGTASYIIEGTFHVILVDGAAADFILPLYVEGEVTASVVQAK